MKNPLRPKIVSLYLTFGAKQKSFSKIILSIFNTELDIIRTSGGEKIGNTAKTMSDQKGDIGSDYNPFEPAWNDTTSTTIEPDGAMENLSYIVLILSLLCALGCLSQLVVIFIARGLQGDYSAKTFLQGFFSFPAPRAHLWNL